MNVNVPCDQQRIADFARKLKAVGHPIRLRLLCLIAREQDPCVSDLWQCLEQPQPVISQHLAILKQAGIVSAEVQKTKRVYSISDPFISDMIRKMVTEA
ncbi:MAG TPA: metalloregulator ArsR/SmtB family transcription factor [Spirochaetales bacterium]|nr:metalloregulator ArsR/SmtB family transcription factor [Spirochaetales bacterium]HPB65958.1 metalloregulator ArsR/SmtB family transcription factor [Spirochaetales bacterium]HPG86282.1 metalloregulator ArsR/SmtB family transcription factor [Spirochaetales bacterium]HPM73654.1 metalloregulator ArsR/SmtB family transcription factor [Spirochaetales bacterium]